MKLAWRIALLISAAVIGWRAISLGLGAHFAAQAETGDDAKLQTARVWDPENQSALAGAARAAQIAARTGAQSGDGEAASEAWAQLLRLNPGSSDAVLGLAATRPDAERGDALVEQATALSASSPTSLKRAALHWLEREQPQRAMAAWSDALLADPGEGATLYPVLLKVLEDDRTRGLLAPYAMEPPAWWEGFFQYASKNAHDVDTVRGLSGLRRAPGAPPLSPVERESYVERLRKDGLTTEAYLVWVNGLDEPRRLSLGLINNGSFETPPSGVGWDWRIRSTRHLLAETAETYGTDGARALHLVFRAFNEPLSHISQELFLQPGAYRFSGKARPNGLKTSGGLQWVVDCAMGETRSRLGESERFLGSSQWEPFDFAFEVPEGCERPVLRLIAAVRVSTDRRIDGSIWFDALRIQRVNQPPTGA